MAPRASGVNSAPIPYEDRLLRVHRRHLERVAHARLLAELVAETGGDVEEERAKRRHAPSSMDLRGLPAVGRGVAGHIRDTQPERYVCR